jgi:FkbM family methyltransferase
MSLNAALYRRAMATGNRFGHVAEVGVYHPETSNIHDFIQDGIRATLVEPEPNSVALIRSYFANRNNVQLHACAVCDFDGEVELYFRGSSTFVASLDTSPAMVNDQFRKEEQEAFRVPCVRFNAIDDGTIDLLSVDIEGGEWFVLKHMKSRPKILSIETHGGAYKNPYFREIHRWMSEHGYRLWYRDGSDSVFVKRGEISVTPGDRLRVVIMDARIALKSVVKKIKNRIRRYRRGNGSNPHQQ